MATEEYGLIAKVDATSANKASTDLDKFTASAAKADAANAKLSDSGTSAASALDQNAQATSRAEKAAAQLAETEGEAQARIHAMVQASMAAQQAATDRMQAQMAASRAASEGSKGEAAAMEAMRAESAAQVAAQNAQMSGATAMMRAQGQLDAVMSASKMTQAEYELGLAAVNDAYRAGTISAIELTGALEKLSAMKIVDANAAKKNASANIEDAAAININARTSRELGTILSEVATGRTGNARRSVGALANSTGLLAKVFTPVGLGITAVAAATAAFIAVQVAGEKESLAYARALATTGAQSGVTAGSLADMSTAIGRLSGEYGDASKAVLALAQAGQGASPALEGMAAMAVNFAKATGDLQGGIKLATTAMTGSASAIDQLDQKYNLLTASQADEVQHLFQIGEADKARQIVMQQGSQALAERAKDVQDSTGTIIKAWDAVTGAVSGAWNAMKNAGATDASSRLKVINSQLDYARGTHMDASQQLVPNASASEIARLTSLQSQYQAQLVQQGWDRTNQALDQAKNQAAKSAQDWAHASLSPIDALQNALDNAVKQRDAFFAVPHTAEQSAEFMRSYTQRIQQAAQAYQSGNKLPAAPHVSASHADTALQTFTNQVRGLQNKADNTVTGDPALSTYLQTVTKLGQAYQTAASKGADLNKLQTEYNAGVLAAVSILNQSTAAQQRQQQAAENAMKAQLAAHQQQINLQVASVGMGQKEIQQAQQLQQLAQQHADSLERLNDQQLTHPAEAPQIKQEIDRENREYAAMVKQTVDGYKAMDAAQADWHNGFTSGIQDIIDQGNNVANMMHGTVTDAFSGMTDAVVNFVQTGKLSLSDLANSFISDMVRMEMQVLESKVLSALFGGMGMGAQTLSPLSMGVSDLSMPMSIGPVGSAKGNVFTGLGIEAYANRIVNSPTYFAAGGNVMGEAGPEAIIPLSRGSNGKLGIQAHGSAAPQVVVNITNKGQAVQAQQTGVRQQGNTTIVDMVINAISGDIAGGGKTAKAMQQRYGLSRRGVPSGM